MNWPSENGRERQRVTSMSVQIFSAHNPSHTIIQSFSEYNTLEGSENVIENVGEIGAECVSCWSSQGAYLW